MICLSRVISCFIIFAVNADFGLSVDRTKRQYVSNIRLSDGLAYKGRVEVYHKDRWGTICDNLWDDDDAKVICRHLGFNGSAIALMQPHFGPGSGPIHMSDVECIGSEYDLSMCSFSGWDNLASGCNHNKDVGVDCHATFIGQPALQWKHEQTYDLTHVRLVGKHDVSLNEGRIEVYHDGKWGSICNDGWNDDNAAVICKMLGYTSGVARSKPRTSISRDRNMVGVQCLGTEVDIARCSFAGWGYKKCVSDQDAGALCGPTTNKWGHENSSTSSHVRIVGNTPYDGQVEVFHDGSWGSICSDYWDNDDATVLCKMFGFPVGEAKNFARLNNSIKLTGLQCIGTETDIALCNSGGFGHHLCNNDDVAGVKCGTDTSVAWSHEKSHLAFTNIRIVGSKMAGRVEVFHNSSWGTICDDFWDNDDASVICRMLGFSPYGAKAESGAKYGQGEGPVYMDDMQCIGTEEDIALCDFRGWNVINCGHKEDAGVICKPKNTKAISWSHEVPPALHHIRLVGSVPIEGRVEIFHNGAWGTICSTGWDNKDAMVVCGMLGFPRTDANVSTHIENGDGHIHMKNVTCKGPETDISLCDFDGWDNSRGCTHLDDAGVRCKSTGIRLSSTYQGTVQVLVNGVWGTICDDSWDDKDAEVVCRMLNLHPVRAYGITSAYFGHGNGPVHMTNVGCVGNEVDISMCKHTVSPTCSHNKDAGVHCSPVDIRLADGNSFSGRVEILYNGEWGTICDDSWNEHDARVVCKMLGLPASHVFAFKSAHFGEGTGPILMNNVRCTGNESDITICRFDGWKNNTCRHNKDASVYCSSTNIITRLVDGQTPNQGRVEVLYNTTWGTICDNSWDDRDASVICRMLGYSPFGAKSFLNSHYGRGNSKTPVHLDNVECNGTESSILECVSNGWNKHYCSHGEDAGVYCPVDTTKVKLVGSYTPYNGDVQVYHNGKWGYICADNWDKRDARVICRMLNMPVNGALAYRKSDNTQNPILMENIYCTGLEMDISSCNFDGWRNGDKTNCDLAGVVCKSETGYGTLVG